MLFKVKSDADIKWLTFAPEYVLGSCLPKYCLVIEPEDGKFEAKLGAESVGLWAILTYFSEPEFMLFTVSANSTITLEETFRLTDKISTIRASANLA